jgi:hypothetical protein
MICVYVWFDFTLFANELDFILIGDVMAYTFPIVTALIIVTQFCLMTLLIKQRFSWLNQKLAHTQHILNKKERR